MTTLNVGEMLDVLDEIRFMDYSFCIKLHFGAYYLQANFVEPDIVTGINEVQYTGRWQLSEHMTKSEFVQTVFKCCMTSMEHRTREHFRYKRSAVYSPHYDVDALVDLCKARQFDYREPM
jgi:hypothetical protein